MRRLLSALFFLSAALTVPLRAQTSAALASLAPGTRVRVTHPGEGTRIATVVALTADTLALELARRMDTVRMPLDQVTQLEISRGMQPDNRLARASVGFVIGTGAGVLLGVVGDRAAPDNCSANELGCSVSAGIGYTLFGLIGGAAGAVVGAVTSGKHEQWDRVSLPPRHVGVSLAPGVGGRGVALRLSLSPAGR